MRFAHLLAIGVRNMRVPSTLGRRDIKASKKRAIIVFNHVQINHGCCIWYAEQYVEIVLSYMLYILYSFNSTIIQAEITLLPKHIHVNRECYSMQGVM